MDTYKNQNEIIAENTAGVYKSPKKISLSHRIFATNWGLAVIGGLVALAIGVSMLHGGYANSQSDQAPEPEQETVALLP
ncbi:MAG: hypothetical protein IJW00_04955 [Clostridia bacterium]|nr:hypothetical protein [Clostridia bacterium]